MHIAIAGAGIMGRVLAWQASRQGHRVTLVEAADTSREPDDQPGASWTAAGMLTPNTEVDVSPELLAMGRESLALWPELAASLDLEKLLYRRGCWVVAHPEDSGELVHFQRRLAQLDIAAEEDYATFTTRELGERAPVLATRFGSALYFPGEASIPPRAVLGALRERLLAAGCDWRDNTRVTALAAQRLVTDRGDIDADVVVDCRGLGAVGKGACDDLPSLRGVRGELVEVHAPDVELDAILRLMHPRYALYIVPRPQQHFVIGATQIESDDRGPVSVRSALELLSAAYSVHPAFAEGRIVATRSNCRPALPDNHPRIGLHAGGAFYINGLYRHGILLAPLLARRALAAVASEQGIEETGAL